MIKDYYQVMELRREATNEEIKAAYRRLAMEYHPDRNRDDPSCDDRIKEINEAYSILGDEDKRRRYDYLAARGFPEGLTFGPETDGVFERTLWAYFNGNLAPGRMGGCRGRGFGRRGCGRWKREF